MPPVIIADLIGPDLKGLNVPPEVYHVADYCRQRGIESVTDLDFYIAFDLFRLAALLHIIKARIARSIASSADAHEMFARLPVVTDLAWTQAREAHL